MSCLLDPNDMKDEYGTTSTENIIKNKPLIVKDGLYFNNTVIPGKTEQMSTGAQRADATGKGKYVLVSPIAMRRISGVYERGAAAYGANNWKKGMPMSRVLDSALRHLYQYIGGDRSEDHLAQAAWNVFAAIHFEETRPELNDLEDYQI
jgi:Domain of unknown function (DUF5664)